MQNTHPFMDWLKKIWPTVHRVITMIVMWLILFIKSSVLYAIKQIKGEI